MHILQAIQFNLQTFSIAPILTVQKIYSCYLLNRVLGITKDVTISVFNERIVVPNHPLAFIVIEELLVEHHYKKLRGLNHILDLGGFLGESAVLLSHFNKKVSVYEADPQNYEYVQKNTANRNIDAFQYAVTANSKKVMAFYKSETFDFGANTQQLFSKKKKITVPCKHIKEVMHTTFDGLKMDIEGGEFEIVNYFVTHPTLFNFKKGYIEFHFQGKHQKNMNTFIAFIRFLDTQGYRYTLRFFNKKVSLQHIEHKHKTLKASEWLLFHLYFEQ